MADEQPVEYTSDEWSEGIAISAKTSFLVAGDKMGPSKLAKAEKLGVPIISEAEFLLMRKYKFRYVQ